MPYEPVDEALARKVPPDVDVRSVPFPSGWLSKPFRKLVGPAVWLPLAYAACSRVIRERRPSAILTSGPPHCIHMLGLFLKKYHRLPWAADFRDPWSMQAKTRIAARFTRWEEDKVFRAADLVVANAPLAEAAYGAAHPAERGKIVTITNGFDELSEAERERNASGSIDVVHLGEIYSGRDPRPYLDALLGSKNGAASAVRYRASFIGRVATGFDMSEEIRRRNLTSVVSLRGQIPYSEALAEMKRAEILLLLDSPGRRFGVPAKLYEYLGVNRPILALAEPDGDVAAILKQSGVLHRLAPPTDVTAIRRALHELGESIRSGERTVGDAAALKQFTRESLTRELAAQLDRIANRTMKR
jgi:hypothetical protein